MNSLLENRYGRIGVLMGGSSSEREISLKSGRAVYESLRASECDVVAIDIVAGEDSEILKQIDNEKIDIAFIALHGQLGEDGKIQELLEKLDIVYTGSGVKASRLAIDKIGTQQLLESEGIRVPPYFSLRKDQDYGIDEIVSLLGDKKFVVKPATEGSSIGITLLEDAKKLQEAIDEAFRYSQSVIIEKFIAGREMTVGIIGEQTLPVLEIISKQSFFDFKAKYEVGMSEYIVPAEISESLAQSLKTQALKAHQALGCEGFSRVDFILNDEGGYVLEVNTIPGFTQTSLLPKSAKVIGFEFNELCFKLLDLAYGKKKENQNTVSHS